MHALLTETVGHTVLKNLKSIDVFNQYGVDYCQQNMWPIEKVCQANSIDPSELFDLLGSLADPLPHEQPDFLNMPLPEICKYIMIHYHQFLYKNVPAIKEQLILACKSQGGKYPELMDSLEAFHEFEKIMTGHLKFEEREFFPFVRDMCAIESGAKPMRESWPHSTREYVAILEDDHQRANHFVSESCELAHFKDPPQDACENYQSFVFKMEQLYNNIHVHIVLEDSDLQPRAIELEDRLKREGKI